MMTDAVLAIASQGVVAFAAALTLLQAAAKEIGYLFGLRAARRKENPGEGVGIVVGGMLGLLAF
ncbi:MAG TPA: hypothetical protein VN329_02680, partial [Roseomonas sp.]|nr:hypothetical protein [Roseomonas sp.]